MRKFLLPIGGALLLIVLSIVLNHSVQVSGVLVGGLVGLGAGFALNHVITKVKQDAEKSGSK